jgi:hypothetical protein
MFWTPSPTVGASSSCQWPSDLGVELGPLHGPARYVRSYYLAHWHSRHDHASSGWGRTLAKTRETNKNKRARAGDSESEARGSTPGPGRRLSSATTRTRARNGPDNNEDRGTQWPGSHLSSLENRRRRALVTKLSSCQ